MYARMQAESIRLEWLGLKHRSYYRPMLERLVDSNDIGALQTLADVVQAPPEYQRGQYHLKATGHEYLSTESYNRLVDATYPESWLAVKFGMMVEDLLAGKASPAEIAEIRALLTMWRDNDTKLQPQIQASFLLKEAAPLSQSLSAVANSGLLALEYLQNGNKAPAGWMEQQVAVIAPAKQPQAELLVSIAPSVEKMVQSAGGNH
jgi:hexosaminidase